MKIIYEHFRERTMYSKIVCALTAYEEDCTDKEFYAEYFYSLLCDIQNMIDHAENENY